MGLVAGTKIQSMWLDFVAKMASSHNGTSPCDLLQGLVPSCVLTFISLRYSIFTFVWSKIFQVMKTAILKHKQVVCITKCCLLFLSISIVPEIIKILRLQIGVDLLPRGKKARVRLTFPCIYSVLTAKHYILKKTS